MRFYPYKKCARVCRGGGVEKNYGPTIFPFCREISWSQKDMEKNNVLNSQSGITNLCSFITK